MTTRKTESHKSGHVNITWLLLPTCLQFNTLTLINASILLAFVEVELLYNVVLVSTVQHESAVCIYLSPPSCPPVSIVALFTIARAIFNLKLDKEDVVHIFNGL